MKISGFGYDFKWGNKCFLQMEKHHNIFWRKETQMNVQLYMEYKYYGKNNGKMLLQ